MEEMSQTMRVTTLIKKKSKINPKQTKYAKVKSGSYLNWKQDNREN